MQHLLVELQRELGMTFVYVTHDQGEALSMSDRVAILSEGKLQQLAPPRDIYYAPRNPFIAQFVGKSNFFPVTVADVGGKRVATLGASRFEVGREVQPGAARLCMRFEDVLISLAEASEAGPVRLAGQVGDTLFMGSTVEVKARCGDLDIIAVLPSSKAAALSSGQGIIVSFDPAKGHVFNV